MLLLNILEFGLLNFLALFFGEAAVSFGLYEISRSLTPLGWIVVTVLLSTLIYISARAVKFLINYNKGKLK